MGICIHSEGTLPSLAHRTLLVLHWTWVELEEGESLIQCTAGQNIKPMLQANNDVS